MYLCHTLPSDLPSTHKYANSSEQRCALYNLLEFSDISKSLLNESAVPNKVEVFFLLLLSKDKELSIHVLLPLASSSKISQLLVRVGQQ